MSRERRHVNDYPFCTRCGVRYTPGKGGRKGLCNHCHAELLAPKPDPKRAVLPRSGARARREEL